MIQKFALILCFITGIVFSNTASAVTLKQNPIVSDATLKLGDIFTGVEGKEDKVLGKAPLPGRDMTLNARILMRIALATNINWRPASNTDFTVVRRAATVIPKSQIEQTLQNAMTDKGITGDYKLSFNAQDIAIPEKFAATLEVENVKISHNSNSFTATIYAPSKTEAAYTANISGDISRLVNVPVLSGIMTKGAIIGESDITFIEMAEKDIQGNFILDKDQLIGMTPRHLINAQKPVNLHDLSRPQIVERGDMVMMTFRQGQLLLTAEGKALQNGSKGDLIRVTNLSSNKSLQARVTGAQEVIVESF